MAKSKGVRLAVKTMSEILSNPKSTTSQKIGAARVIALIYGGKKKAMKEKKEKNTGVSPLLN
jgi:hypothetical protein